MAVNLLLAACALSLLFSWCPGSQSLAALEELSRVPFSLSTFWPLVVLGARFHGSLWADMSSSWSLGDRGSATELGTSLTPDPQGLFLPEVLLPDWSLVQLVIHTESHCYRVWGAPHP